MRKLAAGLAAAAIAFAPFLAPGVAQADVCDVYQQWGQMDSYNGCEQNLHQGGQGSSRAAPPDPGAPAPGAPANPPDDSCKWILNNPQAHMGAYDGCETARRATGSP
jgi:hypothetical protein